MPDYPNLATLLNPLTPLYLAADGVRVVGRAVARVPGAVVDTAGRGVAIATEPMARAGVAGAEAASDMANFLSLGVQEAGKTVRDTTKKVAIMQAVSVAGVVGLAAVAAWYLSKSPEAREKVWTAGKTGARFLLTKGAG